MVGGGGCAPAHRPTLAAAWTSPVVGCRAAAGTPGRTALSRVALRDWHEFHLVRIVVECGLATAGKLIQAKGTLFDLTELLSDGESATRLVGGAYLITYLSPKDYHRVHSPVGGRVIGWRHIPGSLFSVGAKSVASEPGLFVRNERFVTLIEMDGGGLCAVVMVAAIGVGHVTVSYDEEVATHRSGFLRAAVRHRQYDAPKPIRRGEELGIFHLGSTTIVVFEPGRAELGSFAPGEAMKMGIAVGRSRAINDVPAVTRG